MLALQLQGPSEPVVKAWLGTVGDLQAASVDATNISILAHTVPTANMQHPDGQDPGHGWNTATGIAALLVRCLLQLEAVRLLSWFVYYAT